MPKRTVKPVETSCKRIRLAFYGATGTVTGSRYLLTVDEEGDQHKFLIDCGLFQGHKQLRLRNWAPLPFDVQQLDAIVLTHAHIDHSGALPLLARVGYRGPVYCTSATRELATILLPDAAHLQEEDASFANRYGFSKHSPALPLYTVEDARQSLRLLKSVEFDQPHALTPSIIATWHRAGHILGSAWLTIQIGDHKLLFTGDLGRPEDAMMKPPTPASDADWMVVESTYGNRRHVATDPADALRAAIEPALHKGGVVVIPTFAVGRAQSVLLYLYRLRQARKIPSVPVYLNSPMAADATELFRHHSDEHRLLPTEFQAIRNMVHIVNTPEESRHLNTLSGPMIIVSASGMATGGRVLHHIKRFGGDPRNTIVFTGFQAAGTRGARLVEGERELKMFGEYVPIRAKVISLDCLSSHADYSEMVEWLRSAGKAPTRCFITHGEPAAADALRLHLAESLGWRAEVPEYGEVVQLSP